MNDVKVNRIDLLDSFESADRRFIKKGDRVKVKTRHGSTGTGTVLGIRDNNGRCPDTIVVDMDPDTVWKDEGRTKPWPDDDLRSNTFGFFGGEIESVIGKLH